MFRGTKGAVADLGTKGEAVHLSVEEGVPVGFLVGVGCQEVVLGLKANGLAPARNFDGVAVEAMVVGS